MQIRLARELRTSLDVDLINSDVDRCPNDSMTHRQLRKSLGDSADPIRQFQTQAMCLEFTHNFATLSSRQSIVGIDVDVLGNESHRSVTHEVVGTAGVLARWPPN